MTTRYPQIADDLAALAADVAKPVFNIGDPVRATRGPSTIVGEVVAYSHRTQPLMTIHPSGVPGRFSTFDIWADDGWVIEHLVEVPA